MQEHKEELATIESIDSGAVYTLALKTHVGMSIETWRYFAGWTDKIQGSTIPVSHARPNKNLSFTKREPIGYVFPTRILIEMREHIFYILYNRKVLIVIEILTLILEVMSF